MSLTIRRVGDVASFLADAGAFLSAAEGDHTMLYRVCGRLRADPHSTGYLATAARAGDVVGCVAAVPTQRAGVSLMRGDDAAMALADDLAATVPTLPAALVPAEVAAPFVDRFAQATARGASLAMRQRNFAARHVTPPRGVRGRMRAAGESDREVLVGWSEAFFVEALGEPDVSPSAGAVDRMLAGSASGFALWERDGTAVSMAAYTGPTPTGITVLSVYTPPEERGHGYASACTAALTDHLLAGGREQVFLSTDVTNPTSNAIYQRIGFRPLGEAAFYRFGPPQ